MLNRRHLRVKVLQSLYAYQLSDRSKVDTYEKGLIKSVDDVNAMYIWTLNLLDEVASYSLIDAEERANKYLPSDKDLAVNPKLDTNTFIMCLRANERYQGDVKRYKVDWSFDPEIARTIFMELRDSEAYQAYLEEEDRSIHQEKEIIKYIFKKIILKLPVIEQAFDERFIHWTTDKEILQAMIAKTLKNFDSEVPRNNKLVDLTPNWTDDKIFMLDLFTHSIRYADNYNKLIAEKTKNWEADRIALIDQLMMRMAICELIHFPSIPVKVTMNEYIEIAKLFSTAKSNGFINGILDKIFAELQAKGMVRKQGRGLVQ
jgi:N utilization substance protein B